MKSLIVIVFLLFAAKNYIFSQPSYCSYHLAKLAEGSEFKMHTPLNYLLLKNACENSSLRITDKEINRNSFKVASSIKEAKKKKLVRVFLTSTIFFVSLSQFANQHDNKTLGISFASCAIITSTSGLIIYIKQSKGS
jgi:hypothetical protein